ncbi:Hypothetical protein NTJ_03607 [Nesidiocoris tenuis]|uniref:Uncharacterized protein n=1 Tax=Nesidiocoris tenuis TaxID=355587 RepID=A0ABN7AHF2_9HEMI|nr:Hypothetical protein NTJ_03607 [Nesidiocoris tenuis]
MLHPPAPPALGPHRIRNSDLEYSPRSRFSSSPNRSLITPALPNLLASSDIPQRPPEPDRPSLSAIAILRQTLSVFDLYLPARRTPPGPIASAPDIG